MGRVNVAERQAQWTVPRFENTPEVTQERDIDLENLANPRCDAIYPPLLLLSWS